MMGRGELGIRDLKSFRSMHGMGGPVSGAAGGALGWSRLGLVKLSSPWSSHPWWPGCGDIWSRRRRIGPSACRSGRLRAGLA